MAEERPESDGSENFDVPPSFFPQDLKGEPLEPGERELVEVAVEGVFQREEGARVERFVVLRSGYRRLPIVIDPCNAHAISLPLDGGVPDRPLTHDLLTTVIEKLGGEVDRVVIDDLWSTTYYAKVTILKEADEFVVDARPSDAIALAVRCGAAIFVSENILESATD